jgi:hypothetical protein
MISLIQRYGGACGFDQARVKAQPGVLAIVYQSHLIAPCAFN